MTKEPSISFGAYAAPGLPAGKLPENFLSG